MEKRIRDVAAVLALLSVAAFFGTLTYQAIKLPAQVGAKVDAVSAKLSAQDERLSKILDNVNSFVDETYYDNYANVQTTAVLLRELTETVRVAREELLPESTKLIKEATSLVASIKEDSHDMTVDAQGTLNNIDVLLTNVNEQVSSGSSKAGKTAEALEQALRSLDALLANKDNAAILSNVEKTTRHLGESAESVDIALRPWREKAKMLKAILSKALSMIRINPLSPLQ